MIKERRSGALDTLITAAACWRSRGLQRAHVIKDLRMIPSHSLAGLKKTYVQNKIDSTSGTSKNRWGVHSLFVEVFVKKRFYSVFRLKHFQETHYCIEPLNGGSVL